MAQISAWVRRFYGQIPKNGLILDLAGGSGRHTRFLTQQGFKLLLLDNDIAKAKDLQDVENIVLMEYDLEDGSTLPFPKSSFQGVVVTNYLYRPIFPQLLDLLDDGGILIYETFAVGNEKYGRPTNPDYLLKSGELISLVSSQMRIIAYEEGLVRRPAKAYVQRITAAKN
ncbi:MAG: class I SAM-dependent methyltransferase [Pseudomonadota bacterium]|nr:class I SAM-dependent methyltransferase [Pseudomonadota bacterium]